MSFWGAHFWAYYFNCLLDPSCVVVIHTEEESGFGPRELLETVCILVCLWASGGSDFHTDVPYTLNRSRWWYHQLEMFATLWNIICNSLESGSAAWLSDCQYVSVERTSAGQWPPVTTICPRFWSMKAKALLCGSNMPVFPFCELGSFLVPRPSIALKYFF